MKKKFLSLFSLLFAAILSCGVMAACDEEESSAGGNSPQIEQVDYAGTVSLDMASTTTQKMEVTVKSYIDGDTTHFNLPKNIAGTGNFADTGILKARYLAVNTPESTGKIEEWGKKASNFTKEKLQNATSIVLETDGVNWEVDSTGDRHLVWVWYKAAGSDVYRNLNLELLQNGLALGSKSGETRYGTAAVNAINQATQLKLHVFSREKDPDFYYGQAYEIDLKELRMNIDEYNGLKVAFEGYVSYYNNQGVYVESYDEVTDMYYGVYVYYGFFLSSYGEKVLSEGNHVRIVGSVQYWETGDSYQVADLTYDPFDLENPNNIQLLDKEKHPAANHETAAATFNGKIDIDVTQKNEDGEEVEVTKTVDYAEMALGTSISMKGLKVIDAYTTNNGGGNDGAMTLTCQAADGQIVSVRTIVLKDADGNLITKDYYLGKTIDVSGVVDCFDGEYQIKVFRTSSIAIVG